MAKKKRRMGAFPFTRKWFVEKKLRSLSREAETLSNKTSDLQLRVDTAKEEAYRIFPASAYDRETAKIDKAMQDICASAEEARETPTSETVSKKKIGKKCREALGIKPTGGLPKDKAAEWRLCVERGGPNGYKTATPPPGGGAP